MVAGASQVVSRGTMSARNSVLTGSAGEHYVLYRLHREGILAAQSPAGAREADILVFNSDGLGRRIQVMPGLRSDWVG